MDRSDIQRIRDGIDELRDIDSPDSSESADAIERLLRSSLDEVALRLAPADGDLALIYGTPQDPGKVRWNAERCESAGLQASAEMIRTLDRTNVALMRECDRLGNLMLQRVDQMMAGENVLLRRQLEQLRFALDTAEKEHAEQITDQRETIQELREKLATVRQRSNEAYGAAGSAETRLIAEIRQRRGMEREIAELRRVVSMPRDDEQ